MKIEYNGKEVLDIDAVNAAVTKTQEQVSSTNVERIEIVNDYPAQEETGVLYIKLESQNNN